MNGVLVRLSVLMFFQFWIWGAWYLTVSLYMIKHGMEQNCYYAYTAGPLAAILTPFFMGLIADRFFNTERLLAVLFFVGGVMMFLLPQIGGLPSTPVLLDGQVDHYTVTLLGQTWHKSNLFNFFIFLHMLCFMPTLGLTASFSFYHLPKGATQFPLVRLWGTMGWIFAGLALAFVIPKASETLLNGKTEELEAGYRSVQFLLGSAISIFLGFYCWTLPNTPAPKKGQPFSFRELIFWDAWRELRNPSYLIFIACSFLVCIPLAAYYANLQQQMSAVGIPRIPFWKNIGTWVEAGMMFAMPFFFRRLGIKVMIGVGIFAWILRYILFSLATHYGVIAADAPFLPMHAGFWLIILGIALHGFCYDFFFVTGQVYVDRATPSSIRGQAQGMNIFFTQGLGLYCGAIVAGKIIERAFVDANGHRISQTDPAALVLWPKLWLPLAAIAAVVMGIFLILFREPKKAEVSTSEVARDDARETVAPD